MELYRREIEEYVGKRRDPTTNAYGIYSENDKLLAHLFTSRETYTLAWYGRIEFDDFGSLIGDWLLHTLSPDPYDLRYFYPLELMPLTALVSMIIHETEVRSLGLDENIELPPSNPRLERFEIVNGEWPKGRRETFWQPNKISFARVDYRTGVGMWQANSSFTAENPKSRPPGKAEIAIKTPRTYRYSSDLLKFIVQTIRRGRSSEGSVREAQDSLVAALREQLDKIVQSSA